MRKIMGTRPALSSTSGKRSNGNGTTLSVPRPGITIRSNEFAEILKASDETALSSNPTRADILVTVNELMHCGAIRLGVWNPFAGHACITSSAPQRIESHGLLTLTRQIGTSVIIRVREDIPTICGLDDLAVNGIAILNQTVPIREAGRKTGATLQFHLNRQIWKIIRLELTTFRGERQ